ncbi:hypothetical protein Leryth_002133 [Lithospermum erythrorhizon]|nr:hypothetical protein Leryth_002133 [Lithospermum erythrorhizon]
MGLKEGEGVMERTKDGVVVVNPKPKKGFTSKAVDWLEKLIVKLMYDNSQPLQYLSGNFGPILEETPPCNDLPIRGHLPECLNGEFVRVGPNPKLPPVAGHHWFDGDGMIHGIRIKDGKATYVSRYVKTSRLKQEEFFGAAKFMKIGDLKGFFGLCMVYMQMLREKLKVLDVSYGMGTANTALVYHHGKLMALSEADKPYIVKVLEDGDLQTIGMLDYDKRLAHSFTAHPKVDPFTGEMFSFGYSTRAQPYLTYRVISKDGKLCPPWTLPLISNPRIITSCSEMVKDNSSFHLMIMLLHSRYAKNELLIKWFELPCCFIFHNANAWEDGNEVILIACRIEKPDLALVGGTIKEKLENFGNELYEMRFNMETGQASQKKLSEPSVDFPRVNESYVGRNQRYVYAAILDRIKPKKSATGMYRMQSMMSDEPVAVIELPKRAPYGFHAFFVWL